MNIWQRITGWWQGSATTQETTTPTVPSSELTEKQRASAEGRPWVELVGFHINPQDSNMGSFELDWNAEFVRQLRAQGFQGESEEQIVDQWFTNICKNVLMNAWEHEQTDLTGKLTKKRRLDNDRLEFS